MPGPEFLRKPIALWFSMGRESSSRTHLDLRVCMAFKLENMVIGYFNLTEGVRFIRISWVSLYLGGGVYLLIIHRV